MSSIRFVLFSLVSVLLASTSFLTTALADGPMGSLTATTQTSAVVYRNYHGSDDCTGEPWYSQSYSAGECLSAGTNVTEKWYCDADGSKIHYVKYSDSTCTAVSQISQYSSQMCSYHTSYECRNATLGPALPFEYPKKGLFESITYFNTSSGSISETCASTSNPFIRTTSSQRVFGECWPREYDGRSSKRVCTSGGGYNIFITYGDLTCTKPIKAEAETNKCSHGSIGRCNGSPIATVELPTQGFIDYDLDGCKFDSYQPSATFIAKGACVPDEGRYIKMECETDAATGIVTAKVSVYGFSDMQCTGPVTSTTSYLGDGSQCVPPPGSIDSRRKYQCNFQSAAAGSVPSDAKNFDTTGDNSANMIGQSIFGLIAIILFSTIIANAF